MISFRLTFEVFAASVVCFMGRLGNTPPCTHSWSHNPSSGVLMDGYFTYARTLTGTRTVTQTYTYEWLALVYSSYSHSTGNGTEL